MVAGYVLNSYVLDLSMDSWGIAIKCFTRVADNFSNSLKFTQELIFLILILGINARYIFLNPQNK